MGEIVISIILALGLILGAHKMSGRNNDQGPPNCTGSGCGFGGGGGGGF